MNYLGKPFFPWWIVIFSLPLLGSEALADGQKCVPLTEDSTTALVTSLDERTADPNPSPRSCGPVPSMAAGTETLIFIRHGEKTAKELGQLSCTGQNRALLLPDILTSRFGRPDKIYAPNPCVQIHSGMYAYSYVRPFATIEPTAIKHGLAVNTQIGYPDVCELQNALVTKKNSSSLIFVAWEHVNINQFASNILNTYNVQATVPPWGNDDYDRIYVFTITTPTDGGKSTLAFHEEHEGLNDKLAPFCASAPRWPIFDRK